MRLRSLMAASAILASGLAARADTIITYNNAPVGQSTGSYTENGFTSTVLSGSVFYEQQQVEGGDTTNGGVLAVSATNGSLFSFKNFDYILYNGTGGNLTETLVVDGFLNGALVGMSQYTITNNGSGYSPAVTESAGALSGLNLSQLVFNLQAQNSPQWDEDIDNVTLFAATPAATPEPSSVALLGTGVLGVIGVARRRFAI